MEHGALALGNEEVHAAGVGKVGVDRRRVVKAQSREQAELSRPHPRLCWWGFVVYEYVGRALPNERVFLCCSFVFYAWGFLCLVSVVWCIHWMSMRSYSVLFAAVLLERRRMMA